MRSLPPSSRPRPGLHAALRAAPGSVRAVAVCCGLLLVLLLPGCARDATSGFTLRRRPAWDRPPAAARDAALPIIPRRDTTIVVGLLRDPAKSTVAWTGIGSDMTDVLARTMMSEGGWDVRIDPDFGRRVEQALRSSTAQRKTALRQLRDERAEVDYAVVGRVSDFLHTGEVSTELQRTRGFWKRNEAVVAIQLDVVDMRTGEVAATDHVAGIGRTNSRNAEAIYDGISLNSYLFWSTPLGRAGSEAIAHSFAVVEQVLAPVNQSLRIAERLSDRAVRVESRSSDPVRSGVYFAYALDAESGVVKAIYDPITGRAIEVRVDQGGGAAARGLVFGVPPIDVDLRRAELNALPPDPIAIASEWQRRGGEEAARPQMRVADVEPGSGAP